MIRKLIIILTMLTTGVCSMNSLGHSASLFAQDLVPRRVFVNPPTERRFAPWTEFVTTALAARKREATAVSAIELVDRSGNANAVITVGTDSSGLVLVLEDRSFPERSGRISITVDLGTKVDPESLARDIRAAVGAALPALPPREREVTTERVVRSKVEKEGVGVSFVLSALPGTTFNLGNLGTTVSDATGRILVTGLPEDSTLVGKAVLGGYRDLPFVLNVGDRDGERAFRQAELSRYGFAIEYDLKGINPVVSWRPGRGNLLFQFRLENNLLNPLGNYLVGAESVPNVFFLRPGLGLLSETNEASWFYAAAGAGAGLGIDFFSGSPGLSQFARGWIESRFRLGTRTGGGGAIFLGLTSRLLYGPDLFKWNNPFGQGPSSRPGEKYSAIPQKIDGAEYQYDFHLLFSTSADPEQRLLFLPFILSLGYSYSF